MTLNILSDSLLDAFVDTVKLIPFLFLTYLLMEWIERRTESRSTQIVQTNRVGKLGPLFGSLIGVVPQCGFSAAAASLFSGGLISLGTLLSVFLSTSDEMLPIMISNHISVDEIGRILGTKIVIAIVSGFCVDFVLSRIRRRVPDREGTKHIHDLCEDAHCGCDETEEAHGIWKAALIHTSQIISFVFIISFCLNVVVSWFGIDNVRNLSSGHPALGVFLLCAVGLIPNCVSSIMITKLYLDGLIVGGQMMSGLLVSAGVGLLVLFRTNTRHEKENIKITILLYCIGAFWGLILNGIGAEF